MIKKKKSKDILKKVQVLSKLAQQSEVFEISNQMSNNRSKRSFDSHSKCFLTAHDCSNSPMTLKKIVQGHWNGLERIELNRGYRHAE